MLVYLGFTTHICPTCYVISLLAGNPNHCFLEIPGVGIFESTRRGKFKGIVWEDHFDCSHCVDTFRIPIEVPDFDINYIWCLVGRYKISMLYVFTTAFPISWKAKKYAHCSEFIVDAFRYFGLDVYGSKCSRLISPKDLALWANENRCGDAKLKF